MSNKIVIGDDFFPGLEKSLSYLRGFAFSQVIFSFFHEGLFSLLREEMEVDTIAQLKGFNPDLLRTVFEYLTVEGILEKVNSDSDRVSFKLSSYGQNIESYQGWFNLLVGGYSTIFSNISGLMKYGTNYVSRNGQWVGIGSCQISHYDAFPLAMKMIQKTKPDAKLIVDYGCGSALTLCTFCEQNPDLKAIGVEPDKGAYQAGLDLIAERNLQNRVKLFNSAALDHEIGESPDLILFWFVLQEIYGQEGEEVLIDFIRSIGKDFPQSYLHVIEVDYAIDREEVMQSQMGLGYYNPYFLVHPFTNQKLVCEEKWNQIFTEAGLRIVNKEVVDPKVDPTGLLMGYVLAPVAS